jgi:hypothetical protein
LSMLSASSGRPSCLNREGRLWVGFSMSGSWVV